jgi:MFS family permease
MFPGPALALVTAAFALSALSALAVAPLSPFLLESLVLSRAQVGLFLPAVYLGGVAMSLPSGWLVDRLGVRRTLALGQALMGILVALASLAPGLVTLLACFVGAGFGFSVTNPATGRAIIDWFPPSRRGMAMGIKQTGLTLGGVAGALALPPLAQALGWRDALGLVGVLSLASAAVVATLYRDPAAAPLAAPAARPRLAELGGFFERPAVRVVFGCGFALSVAQASLLAYLVLYAKEVYALSPVIAGRLLALAHLGGTAARLVWGVVSDRFFGGLRRPGVVVSALIGAAGYVVFALAPALPAPLLALLAFLVGVGAFGWVGLYLALVAEIGGARYAGLLTGVAVMFTWSGVLVGPLLFGSLVEAAGAYRPAWLALAGIAVGAAWALARLRPLVQRDRV